MIRELVDDEGILTTPCAAADADDAEVATDLVDTLSSLEDAGCLAANQIGVVKAICAYRDEAEATHVLFNPRLVFGLAASKVPESCLTHELPVTVTRYAKVKIGYDELVDGTLRSRKRDFTGFTAQMIQHMIDHCHGRLV